MVLPPPRPRPRKGSGGAATWRTSRTLGGGGLDPPARQARPHPALCSPNCCTEAPPARRDRLSAKRPTPRPTRGSGPASLTDWLVLQETHVVQSLALLGSQVLQPETDDALSLLQGTGREDSE